MCSTYGAEKRLKGFDVRGRSGCKRRRLRTRHGNKVGTLTMVQLRLHHKFRSRSVRISPGGGGSGRESMDVSPCTWFAVPGGPAVGRAYEYVIGLSGYVRYAPRSVLSLFTKMLVRRRGTREVLSGVLSNDCGPRFMVWCRWGGAGRESEEGAVCSSKS